MNNGKFKHLVNGEVYIIFITAQYMCKHLICHYQKVSYWALKHPTLSVV